jgi:predicted small lipoprotein YifL
MATQSLYGAARIGELVVISNLRPTPGWAVVVLSVVALALAGCGRKGGLDLPPSASGANGAPQAAAALPTDTEREAARQPSVFNSAYGNDASPQAARGDKKSSFVLDPLLDERR